MKSKTQHALWLVASGLLLGITAWGHNQASLVVASVTLAVRILMGMGGTTDDQ